MLYNEWVNQQEEAKHQREQEEAWERTAQSHLDAEIYHGPGPRESTIAEAKAAIVDPTRFWFVLSTIFPQEKLQEIKGDFDRV